MLVPILVTLVVSPLVLATLHGRPVPFRDARARLVARNPMLGDVRSRWGVNYVSHRWSARSNRTISATRALATRLIVAAAFLFSTYCDRRPAATVPVWYDR